VLHYPSPPLAPPSPSVLPRDRNSDSDIRRPTLPCPVTIHTYGTGLVNVPYLALQRDYCITTAASISFLVLAVNWVTCRYILIPYPRGLQAKVRDSRYPIIASPWHPRITANSNEALRPIEKPFIFYSTLLNSRSIFFSDFLLVASASDSVSIFQSCGCIIHNASLTAWRRCLRRNSGRLPNTGDTCRRLS